MPPRTRLSMGLFAPSTTNILPDPSFVTVILNVIFWTNDTPAGKTEIFAYDIAPPASNWFVNGTPLYTSAKVDVTHTGGV